MPLILKKKIKKNKSETLPLKVSSILTNLVIFQGIYKKKRELKEKERERERGVRRRGKTGKHGKVGVGEEKVVGFSSARVIIKE